MNLQPGQVPCPYCAAPIPLRVDAILAGRSLDCAGCGAQLTVAAESSQQALARLEQWYRDIQAADRQVTASIPETSPARSGGGRRRGSRRS